jgi:hypothetical protein
VPPQRQRQVTWSIAGRCQSTTVWPCAASAARLPTTSIARQASQRHTGTGAPQKRWRDTAQSRALASQSANRLSPTWPGTQWILRLFATSRSLNAVTRTNQLGIER